MKPYTCCFVFGLSSKGYTLLELIITLCITALLLLVTIPSLSGQVQKSRLETATSSLYEAIQTTRTQAVMLNQRVTLRHKGSWQDGWEIFMDTNHNGLRDEGEILLLETSYLGHQIQIIGNAPVRHYISFIGTGESRYASKHPYGGFQAGTLTICSQHINKAYQLILNRAGRLRSQLVSVTDNCSD